MICFLVAFAAGLTVGIESQKPDGPQESSGRRCGGLSTELNLTPQQREQMHRIWSDTARRGGREREERRRELWRERDQAIAQLIRPEDQAQYDQVIQSYTEKLAALDQEWRTSFDAAITQTKEILTPEQREKYDRMLQRHRSERGGRGGWYRGPRPPMGSPLGQPPASAPAA